MYFAQWRVTGACWIQSIALFSGPKGPASLCHWMPVSMYPWCSKIHLFDLPLWMTDFHLVVLSTLLSSGCWCWSGLPGKMDELELWLFFYSANFVTVKVIISTVGMSHIGRLIDWSPTNIHLKTIIQISFFGQPTYFDINNMYFCSWFLGIFVHTTATHWIFSLFLTFFC